MKYVFQELRNPTKTDFEFSFDGSRYVIKAGSQDILPDFVAKLGARKLADREWKAPLDTVGYEQKMQSFLGELQNEKSEVKKPTLTEEIAYEKELLKNDLDLTIKVVKEPEKEFAALETMEKKT